jgi:hypothetical protein
VKSKPVPVVANIDLRRDASARWVVKDEVVQVAFARDAGEISSREGPNGYVSGDALVVGSTGDRWSVSRARFDAKYIALPPLSHGVDGAYRSKLLPVLAKQMPTAFAVERSAGGDLIRGNAGDWLMQYAPGDYGIVENAKFNRVYRPAD